MTLALRIMDAADIARFIEVTYRDYIESLIEAGRSPEQAQKDAVTSQEGSFRDGVPINGNVVFEVVDDETRVGVLWIGPRDGLGFWWIYEIEIEESFRGRGFGRGTMLLAEQAVRERGGTALGLNVFGTNATARNLYESLGYQPTSIQMRKPLD